MTRTVLILAIIFVTSGICCAAAPADSNAVTLNTSTLKYHCPTCKWALKCTRNCVQSTLGEAKQQGAKACKVCRGRCR